MSEISGVATGRGRGRGRGRGLFKPQIGSEDAVDGCIVRSTPSMQELTKRFDDRDDLKNDSPSVKASPSTIGTNVEKSQISTNAASPQREEANVSIVVVSIKYDEDCAEIKFKNKDLIAKCKVQLYQSVTMMKWRTENPLICEIATAEKKALLSALELNLGAHLIARKVIHAPKEECFIVSIDVFEFDELRQDFMSSLIYCLIPRLPAVDGKKIAVISNLRGDDEIDVVFYGEVWLGLRKTLHTVQMEKKLFQPRCPVLEELYKEMIDGFNSQSFLAPLNDDWSELHRVKILGLEQDHVKVLYVDIGKQCRIPVRNLSIPTLAKYVPDLIDKVPAQAVTLRVVKMNSRNSEILKTMKAVFEGRVCYVKTVDDSKVPPVVDVYITNSQGKGTVSLSDLTTAILHASPPPDNLKEISGPLNTIQKKLEGLVTDFKAAFDKESKSNEYGRCECCKEKVLGICGNRVIPSVSRSIYSESLRT